MPVLPSLFHKPTWKASSIKSSLSRLRGEGSSSTSPSPSNLTHVTEVLDIKDKGRYSLDFDGGRPASESDKNLHDEDGNKLAAATNSPLQLDVQLSQESFTLGFLSLLSEANDDPRSKSLPDKPKEALDLSKMNAFLKKHESVVQVDDDDDDDGYSTSSEDIAANAEAMDVTFTRKAAPQSLSPKTSQSGNRSLPKPLQISTAPSSFPAALTSQASKPSRPYSIVDTPPSSTISGTTLARALLSNSFSLSNDNRNQYRQGGAGLTRSDSTTLPRGDHSPLPSDHFPISPDAPPIPDNAERLYEPPRKGRGGLGGTLNNENGRKTSLKRRSSTGNVNLRRLPDTPASTASRPNSDIISPTNDDDDESILLPPTLPEARNPPPSPRPPLPPPPIQTQAERVSVVISYEEAMKDQASPSQYQSPSQLRPYSLTSSAEDRLSTKNLEDVLDYYSLPETPEPLTSGFKPMFSPISEESNGQLTPHGPYRLERRESRQQPVGARSPLSGNIRARVDSLKNPSGPRSSIRQLSFDSIGEEPDTSKQNGRGSQFLPQAPSSPTSARTSMSAYSTSESDIGAPLEPPQLGHIFNRQRAGSSPSPIKVIRDSRDLNSYQLTMTPFPGEPDFSAAEEYDDNLSQRFPETPAAFSPLLSANGTATRLTTPQGEELPIPPMPTTPLSAGLPIRNKPNFAQQMLNRSATSAVHMKQSSFEKPRGSASNRTDGLENSVDETTNAKNNDTYDLFNRDASSKRESAASQTSQLSAPNTSGSVVSRSPSRGASGQASDTSSMYTSHSGLSGRKKTLPPIPISPTPRQGNINDSAPSPVPSAVDVIIPPQITPVANPPSPSLPPDAGPPGLRNKLTPLTITSQRNPSDPNLPIPINDHDSLEDSPSPSIHQSEVGDHLEPNVSPTSSRQKSTDFTGRASDIFRGTSLGSPPPYYTVVSDSIMRDTVHAQLLTGGLPNSPMPSGSQQSRPDWSTTNLSEARQLLGRDGTTTGQRSRVRPPLPAGPRRPSQQSSTMNRVSAPARRDREGSISSINSNPLLASRRSSRPGYLASPRFQVPPPKWRGYTMEAAKWTFTSGQLQSVVSRAIRQSAEASSIRLLREDVLEHEIPEEVLRLESQRTDLKNRYKLAVRRRTLLFDSLAMQLNGSAEDIANGARLIDDLRDMATTLDRLAEELHSLDEQLSYLYSLTHIHSGSALAMALRKLNTSFLKQVAENQVLRNQIQSLEAERDEAWSQAEDVAKELDSNMSGQITTPSSRRSSRVSAVRKSSIRVSKAGLRSGQRVSQRLSVSSNMSQTPLSARSPLRFDRAPPVPPIPRTPVALDLSSETMRRNSRALSTAEETPNSEMRTMLEVQDELYAMLGIVNPEQRIRRTRSANVTRRESLPLGSALPGLLSAARGPDCNHSTRRSSLPPDSTLAEAYNIMAADRHAVLATIDMLSSTD